MDLWQIIILFFLIAVLYSSVGFGGGSSYLALLTLFGIEYQMLRICALICNIIVVTTGVLVFHRKGLIKWRKLLPLVLFSVPFAFFGGYIKLQEHWFFILLAILLFIAAMLMLFQSIPEEDQFKNDKASQTKSAGIGGFIGFVSGLVGIGGGVFLAPVLHLEKWDKIKVIAATSSVFILVNSVAGISGIILKGGFELDLKLISFLGLAVFLGGQIGSRLSADFFKPQIVRKLTALLILFVAIRIIIKYGGYLLN